MRKGRYNVSGTGPIHRTFYHRFPAPVSPHSDNFRLIIGPPKMCLNCGNDWRSKYYAKRAQILAAQEAAAAAKGNQ